ncbi:MAG: peptide chain release factor N(5)-glutamine methyltransferase [Limnobacter sp.]|uniref:peptide chain release factor N(5)-glutamine methyltransferase n=1 Tax=Limnobacter sp. TaxID=2003368 RepID=UPI00391BF933
MPPTSLSLNALLRLTAGETGLPISELRILAEAVTGWTRARQVSLGEDPLAADTITAFKHLATRRQQGEPVAYLLGYKEFYSRPFKVSPSVLIPRPETEELVTQALAFLHEPSQRNLVTRVLDIGCGSGAIAITLALENPILEVTATDICPDALAMAQANAQALGARNVRFVQSNLFEALLNQSPPLAFDLICSNPPYIEAGDPHLAQGDLRFEPAKALTDFGDGLHFYRSIAEHSPTLLRPGGAVLVEHGHTQQHDIIALFQAGPYHRIQGLNDLAGTPRMVMAHLAPEGGENP